jgi:nucleotide-binding universal stress UspA family protein
VIRVLNVVNVTLPPIVGEITYVGDDIEALRQETQKAGEQLVASVANSLDKSNVKIETAVREGDPASMIVEQAREWQADLIVVGSHGYTGLKRLVLGSVAQSVVSHAPCSVEVVRRKEES